MNKFFRLISGLSLAAGLVLTSSSAFAAVKREGVLTRNECRNGDVVELETIPAGDTGYGDGGHQYFRTLNHHRNTTNNELDSPGFIWTNLPKDVNGNTVMKRIHLRIRSSTKPDLKNLRIVCCVRPHPSQNEVFYVNKTLEQVANINSFQDGSDYVVNIAGGHIWGRSGETGICNLSRIGILNCGTKNVAVFGKLTLTVEDESRYLPAIIEMDADCTLPSCSIFNPNN